jgi:D-methionine transport system permease protein
MTEAIAAFLSRYGSMLLQETGSTIIMTGAATLFAYALGLPMGVLLTIAQPHGIWPHRTFHRVLGWIVNIGRSLPFIIMIVLLFPVTKFIVGTKLGVRGAIVPLIVAAAPFVARMVETSLAEVDDGVIEAAKSMGATIGQIVWKFYLPEALPSLTLGGSISLITILAYTAIAGAVGAGGLGDVAVRYGYHRSEPVVLVVTAVLLIVIVQIIQSLFNYISKKMDKRIRQ